MNDKLLKEFFNFLDKHTPAVGGCMVCIAKFKRKVYNSDIQEYEYQPSEEYMLVERRKTANGYMFTINKRFFYDYEFTWDSEMPWEILYKKIV